MTELTPTELTLVNTHPHQTKLYLSIYDPEVALVAQTSGEYSQDTRSVTYTTITGSYLGVTENLFQVALVGTEPYLDDKGRTWVRSADGTTLKFVESDHINWEVGDYVTILKYTEIIPVFPRIIQDPANEENVIFYKNYDIAYTNQNEILGSFIVMGCNYAGFVDPDTGSCDVYWSAVGTTNLIGDSLSYQWIFEGATVTGSTSQTPGNISYTTPGHYRTFLTVTSSSGRVETSVRYVSIYDRPGEGDSVPILNWELSESPSGSRETGGYRWSIRVREEVSYRKIRDGALVVIFADEWYGNTKTSIGGNSTNRQTIKFVGYIRDGTIRKNYLDNYVEFEVVSPTLYMQDEECFSVSVESKTNPTTWYELKDMDCRRAIYHYLAWHSTALICCDFTWINPDDDRYIQFFDADRTSLYDAIQTLMGGTLNGRFISDRQGNLFCEKDHDTVGADRYTVEYEITKRDWIADPIIDEKLSNEVSFIEMGGIAYDPVSGASVAYLASAPGVAPRYKGRVERIQGLALTSQEDLNTQVGNLLANLNAPYAINMQMRGNFSNFDLVPLNCVGVTLEAEDTPRKLSWDRKKFGIYSIAWVFDAEKQVLIPTISMKEMKTGFSGTTIVIPEIPPDEGDYGGSYDQPPFVVPPLPVVPSSATGTIIDHVLLSAHFSVSEDDIFSNRYIDFYSASAGHTNGIVIDTHNLIQSSNPYKLNLLNVDGVYYIETRARFVYEEVVVGLPYPMIEEIDFVVEIISEASNGSTNVISYSRELDNITRGVTTDTGYYLVERRSGFSMMRTVFASAMFQSPNTRFISVLVSPIPGSFVSSQTEVYITLDFTINLYRITTNVYSDWSVFDMI